MMGVYGGNSSSSMQAAKTADTMCCDVSLEKKGEEKDDAKSYTTKFGVVVLCAFRVLFPTFPCSRSSACIQKNNVYAILIVEFVPFLRFPFICSYVPYMKRRVGGVS